MPARVGGEGEGDASSLTNSERDGRGRGRGRDRGGPPPPPPLVPTATVPSLRIFAPMGVISPTTASGRVVPPPPPARAPASASALSLGRGANRTAPPPPPKPKLPTSSELAGVIASLEAAVEAEREEMEAGEVKIPPPKPPPPKPPQPPPPKPPKPPPPKPPKPPAGAPPPEAMVSRAKKMRISLREADPIVVPTPTEKPSSSDEEEEEESESEPEEGEIAPRLVELLPQDDFTAKENDEDGLASPTFKKAKPDATSHDLMGGGEFDTLESLTRVQDVSAEVLNNINSPQFRKRTPISPPQKLANDSKCLDAKLKRLLEVRKLPLVLDLDHTLLNTVLVRDLRQNASTLINAMRLLDADVARAAKTNNPLARSVFHLEHMDLLTKLRPGVRLFLEKASELFELHINTMGSQLYADQMAALLDPKRRWINGEIRGLGEMEDGILIAPSEKSLNGTLEGIADACLIFDDTVSVWASHRRNLITCERYLFFPNARKQFGLPGLSLLDVGQDECAEEGMLATAMKVLTSVHKDYFDRYDALNRPPSVADILQEHRKDVLAGVNIVFSRVFPIHTDPTNHPLWTLAEDFGAKCSPTLTEETTHVVAAARTTDKVKEAIKRGNIRIVSPQWLECSILLWKRANEHTFSVGK